jgi:hypothetical protein
VHGGAAVWWLSDKGRRNGCVMYIGLGTILLIVLIVLAFKLLRTA